MISDFIVMEVLHEKPSVHHLFKNHIGFYTIDVDDGLFEMHTTLYQLIFESISIHSEHINKGSGLFT